MKETNSRKKGSLVLNKETVKQLTGAALADVAGGAVPQQKTGQQVAEFSGGPQCTAGLACTFNWTCSCICHNA